MKPVRILLFSCLGFCFLILIAIALAIGSFVWLEQKEELNAADTVGSRLRINKNAETVREYVYCELLVLGSPIADVESNLSQVGVYHVYGENVKKYTFDESSIAYLLGEIHLTYNEYGILIEKGKQVGFGDYERFNCSP